MNAKRNVLAGELPRESGALRGLALLAELVANRHLDAALGGERLDGLDAAVVRTREDPFDREFRERGYQLVGLMTPAFVEWTTTVVALPL